MTLAIEHVTQILDSAETGLFGVSRSMLTADLDAMRESQAVLEQLVIQLRHVRETAPESGCIWPAALRTRLNAFQGKLRRLEILGGAAMGALNLRTGYSSLSTGAYTARGTVHLCSEPSTLALDC